MQTSVLVEGHDRPGLRIFQLRDLEFLGAIGAGQRDVEACDCLGNFDVTVKMARRRSYAPNTSTSAYGLTEHPGTTILIETRDARVPRVLAVALDAVVAFRFAEDANPAAFVKTRYPGVAGISAVTLDTVVAF
jgi:hypothetical protein